MKLGKEQPRRIRSWSQRVFRMALLVGGKHIVGTAEVEVVEQVEAAVKRGKADRQVCGAGAQRASRKQETHRSYNPFPHHLRKALNRTDRKTRKGNFSGPSRLLLSLLFLVDPSRSLRLLIVLYNPLRSIDATGPPAHVISRKSVVKELQG